MIHDGHVTLGRALQGFLGRSSRALFQGFQGHPEAVAVIDEAGGREGQHFGLEQIHRHLVDGLQDDGALGDEPVPVDFHHLDGKVD